MTDESTPDAPATAVRIGRAAEMLGVSVDTVRRWIEAGRLQADRSKSGQRMVRLGSLADLLAERRRLGSAPTGVTGPFAASSARNRFEGIVTRIDRDRVAAVVEVQAGAHRLVSLMTAEAVEELGLEVGDRAACVIKATNVVVERTGGRSHT